MSYINKNTLLRSFIVVPLVLTSVSMTSVTNSVNNYVAAQASDTTTQSVSTDAQLTVEREEAAKIDTYYTNHSMPLAGYGMKMVLEAQKHDIDWRLIPAISVRESTGGEFMIANSFNPFGWGSGKIKFSSYDEGIEVMATNLGGDNPKTAKYYDGKNLDAILKMYNPPSVVEHYSGQVQNIMDAIANTQVN